MLGSRAGLPRVSAVVPETRSIFGRIGVGISAAERDQHGRLWHECLIIAINKERSMDSECKMYRPRCSDEAQYSSDGKGDRRQGKTGRPLSGMIRLRLSGAASLTSKDLRRSRPLLGLQTRMSNPRLGVNSIFWEWHSIDANVDFSAGWPQISYCVPYVSMRNAACEDLKEAWLVRA